MKIKSSKNSNNLKFLAFLKFMDANKFCCVNSMIMVIRGKSERFNILSKTNKFIKETYILKCQKYNN